MSIIIFKKSYFSLLKNKVIDKELKVIWIK